MALIEVQDLTKTYGKKTSAYTALRGVNLKIEQGESVAIIGKSGSGKSTLMHLMALLDTPTEGTIKFAGKNTADFKEWESDELRNEKFGFVFQQFYLNSRESVLNNVMLPLEIAGMGRSERRQRAMDALAAVDLVEKAKAKANDLSGGQKQRVCIARALVNAPEVIFADEPTGNLDSVTGKKIEDILLQLNKEKGITLIMVTHDSDLARRCKRRVYLKDGQVVDYAKRARKAAKTKDKNAKNEETKNTKAKSRGGKK